MKVFELDNSSILFVARLMMKIKPEWWDSEGATEQLSTGIGWYLGIDKEQPLGWVLCKEYKDYRTIGIECLGYDDNGNFNICKELQPLIEKAEEWAKKHDFAIIRFIIGSRGLSCHRRDLRKPWEELRDIHAVDREEYNWFLSIGYEPSGILPNIYGDKWHGIILLKRL